MTVTNKTIETESTSTRKTSRRRLLQIAGIGSVGAAIAYATRKKEPVFIAGGCRYESNLEVTLRDGLTSLGFKPGMLRGKRVLLKPNLVEPSKEIPHMTTHPAMILAAAEVFRKWGSQVKVGEAPGHVRDTEMAPT